VPPETCIHFEKPESGSAILTSRATKILQKLREREGRYKEREDYLKEGTVKVYAIGDAVRIGNWF
jgi:hypothetical protein